MSAKQFFTGSGAINTDDRFISLRMIKEAMEKDFRLNIIEESPNHLKCKIIRYARIYAVPVLFPNPTISLSFNNERNTIEYEFFWPDYYMVVLAAVIIGIAELRESPLFIAQATFFFAFLVFLDSKCVAHRVRKALNRIMHVK